MAVYTWEGNQVNITCEVFAYPSATISWFRDGQLLPSSNYSNIKIYSSPAASYLEVSMVGLTWSTWTLPWVSLGHPEQGVPGITVLSLGPARTWSGAFSHLPLSSLWFKAKPGLMVLCSLTLFLNNLPKNCSSVTIPENNS